MIPYSTQNISEQDIEAVIEVLRSRVITQGNRIGEFENAVATKVSASHAVAFNSATSALHVACLALGLDSNGLVWTSPISFVASSNCALYCGARVDFVDIDPLTFNMSVPHLRAKLEKAAAEGNLPSIVIPVHFAGNSCEMEAIHELSQQYGFKIIEDASHAIGGKYKGKYIGDCRYSDITIFSFHPVKIITTGEGGLATTGDPALNAKMLLFRSHGITRNPELLSQKDIGAWYYEQIDLGYNYRITDFQAALGLSQMSKLDTFIGERNEIAKFYDEKLASLPLILPVVGPDSLSAFHLYPVQIDTTKTTKTRREVFDFLRANGIEVNVHYIPIHTQPYYRNLGFKETDFPNAVRYYDNAISIPLYPGIGDKNLQFVLDKLKEALV